MPNELYEDYCINSCWSWCFGKRWIWPTPYECFPTIGKWVTPQSVRRRVDVLVVTEPPPLCQSCYEDVVDCITCILCCACQRLDRHLENRKNRIEGRENKVGKKQDKELERADRHQAYEDWKVERTNVIKRNKEKRAQAKSKGIDQNSLMLEQMPPKPAGVLSSLFGRKNKGQQPQQQGGDFQQQGAQYTQPGHYQAQSQYNTIDQQQYGQPTHQQYVHHTHR